MKDLILRIFSLLIPPSDADPLHVRNYRSAVSAFIVVLCMSVGFMYINVAWAKQVNDLSQQVSKKADASDMDLANRRIKRVELMIVRNSLKDEVWNACTAIQSRNQAALNAANREIEQDAEDYARLSGNTFVREPCDVVLIAQH